MNYKELNKNQKDRMKQISSNSYTMEWENPEFMDCLSGGLPRIRKYQNDKNITLNLFIYVCKSMSWDLWKTFHPFLLPLKAEKHLFSAIFLTFCMHRDSFFILAGNFFLLS